MLAKWREVAPARTIGLLAPFCLTHRVPPSGSKLWPHDAATGDFRISDLARSVLMPLREAIDALQACCVVFRSPDTYSASTANREQIGHFFTELATADAIGVERIWVPGGLWEVRAAVKLAAELGITCALDPLVRDPSDPEEAYEDLDAAALYLRIENAGRAGPIRDERLEDLTALIEHYEDLSLTVAFASTQRWNDARNLQKLLQP